MRICKVAVEASTTTGKRGMPIFQVTPKELMELRSWNDTDAEQFAQDTHIVLAAADFSKELTTAVVWLIEREIGIRCVRMKPWRMEDGTVLLDVQQLIPLPEAIEFQTQI